MGCGSSKDADQKVPAVTATEAPADSNGPGSKSAHTETTSTIPVPPAMNTSAPVPAASTENKVDTITDKKFVDFYKLGKELGSGAFSIVKEGTSKKSGESFAIKIVTKSKLTKEDEIALKDEINVLGSIQHPNIIRLYQVYDEPEYYYLVTEKMMGGELFDRIVQKSYYNEKEARDVCLILFRAIEYCHKQKVAHRDLKPENLLLLSDDNDSNMKIADFGFAKRCPKPNCLTTQCGTPGYVAPEILEGVPYDTQIDMWSLGVIVYILLGGYPPFIEQDQRDLFRKIRRGQYVFHEEYWGQVSGDAKDLIRSLLTVSPTQRLTASTAIQDKWMTGDDEILAKQDLGANLHEFRKFNAKRKLKAAVHVLITAQKLTSLGQTFKRDIEGSTKDIMKLEREAKVDE